MIIETERLILSRLGTADASFIFELLNSPGWLQYIGDRGIKDLTDAEKYILNGPGKSYHEFGFGLYKVSLKSDRASIGICGLLKRETLEDADIGFAFLPQYAGKGYAYESAAAVLDEAKSQYRLKRVVAITVEDNLHSIHLLKKTGMHFEQKIKMGDEELMLFAKNL